jgi:hypothetical protein
MPQSILISDAQSYRISFGAKAIGGDIQEISHASSRSVVDDGAAIVDFSGVGYEA